MTIILLEAKLREDMCTSMQQVTLQELYESFQAVWGPWQLNPHTVTDSDITTFPPNPPSSSITSGEDEELLAVIDSDASINTQ